MIYKFRSMHMGADKERHGLADQNEYSGPMFKIKEDPRVTRVGSVLRRRSLGELPHILNVVKGEMSLVGPRPLWLEEPKQCRGWTQKRLDITPGITGPWQVLGRSDISFDEMVELDYMYVTGWSLSWDLRLLQTLPAVLEKCGAYGVIVGPRHYGPRVGTSSVHGLCGDRSEPFVARAPASEAVCCRGGRCD